MRKSINFIVLLILMWTPIFSSYAQDSLPSGISFYVLRVIYSQEQKNGVSLTAYNKTSLPYLVQSFILPVNNLTGGVDLNWKNKSVAPFIVTPPLARLEENSDLTLRIRRNGESIPEDRESVFFISMKAMPAQKPDRSKMVMTVTTNIKLFYRPTGLEKRAVSSAAPKLIFSRKENQLIAHNPTPYWLTFSQLSVGKSSLDKPAMQHMVAPFDKQIYTFPANISGRIKWKLIDEDGWDTPESQQDN